MYFQYAKIKLYNNDILFSSLKENVHISTHMEMAMLMKGNANQEST